MTKEEALEYLKYYFLYNTEARSYSQDITDDGVFTYGQTLEFDDETLINVVEDLKDQIREEIGYLLG